MYNSLFMNPFYWILLIILLVIIIICYVMAPKIIGWFGEHWTREVLKKLPKDKYIVLNDILIAVDDKTYQIDHIVVSSYGVFSIETKQYNGYIKGSKYDKQWVRYIGKKQIYYTNPIRQNYGHVKALAELLKQDEKNIHNVVCIPSNAKLSIKHDGELVRYNTLLNKILSYQNVVIDDYEKLAEIIQNSIINDKKARREHIKNIKNNIIDNTNDYCPKCGGKLIKKVGTYGEFIGCSNYPKCRYTIKQ